MILARRLRVQRPPTLQKAITRLLPTAYWRFNEASGTSAASETGAHNATHSNTSMSGKAPLIQDGGYAVTYSGGKSTISTNILPNTGTTGPVSFLFTFKNTSEAQAIFWDKLSTVSSNRIFLAINRGHLGNASAGKLCIFTNSGTPYSNLAMTSADSRTTDGSPHLFIFVVDGANSKIYVDGDDLALSGSALTGQLHLSTGHVIGSTGGGAFPCSLTVDDTAVFYNKTLTPSDVAQLYAAFLMSK